MEGRIKSALEKALERAESFKEVPQEEIEKIEYFSKGQAIGANFLRDMDYSLKDELNKYGELKIKRNLLEGIEETLLKNLSLPINGEARKTNKRAMEGLFMIKENKKNLTQIFGEIDYFFNYYEDNRKQVYQRVKNEFTAKAKAAAKKLAAQLGREVKIDPEKQPGLKEEWLKVTTQLNRQFEEKLNEIKAKVKMIS